MCFIYACPRVVTLRVYRVVFLVPVPCGAGTFYHIEREVCALCSVGDYQNKEAQFGCKRCPDGTTSVERGATNATQCVGMQGKLTESHVQTSLLGSLAVSPVVGVNITFSWSIKAFDNSFGCCI